MSTTSPSLERAEYITGSRRVKHYLRVTARNFMFFQLCPRKPIKQNTQNGNNFIKLSFIVILFRNGVHIRPARLPHPPTRMARFQTDSRNRPKGLEVGRESGHIHFRKTGGHILRQSGQGREAATVTKFDMGRSVFHLSYIYMSVCIATNPLTKIMAYVDIDLFF